MKAPALRVFAAIMTAVMAMGLAPCPQVFADKKKQPAIEKASFTSYELVTFEGGIIKIGVEGKSFTVSTDAANIFEITLYKADNSSIVRRFKKQSGEFSIDLDGYMDKGKLYFVAVSYQLGSKVITQDDNYIFLGDDDQIHFYKSPTYAFNVERCTELRDDEVSLKECLQPQNDIECDDPVIIEYSKQICEGAETDWDKVYHIYTYLIGAMAYDNTQTDKSNKMVYQDGSICLLRRGMAVCEGFGNVFTALCRAQGIPATVEFGVGLASFDEMMADNLPEDETPDHAWAAVYVGGKWRFVDPTYDSGMALINPSGFIFPVSVLQIKNRILFPVIKSGRQVNQADFIFPGNSRIESMSCHASVRDFIQPVPIFARHRNIEKIHGSAAAIPDRETRGQHICIINFQ